MNRNLNTVFLELLVRDIDKVKVEIEAINDEKKLWMTTGMIKNPVGNLCLHLTGVLNHFIGAVLGNTGYVRNYEEEFTMKDISREQLIANLDLAKIVVKNTLLNLSENDLNKMYPKKVQEKEVPVYWFLSHLLTHVNYHLGQMNYLRRVFYPSQSQKPIMTSTVIKPPFTKESALAKVKIAEEAWNTRDPQKVSLAYSVDSKWRNRNEFFSGREQIQEFLTIKWQRELNYKLMKELWCFHDNRISVRFEYEWRDANDPKQWYRTHGNEHWEFDQEGLMCQRDMSANDYPIEEKDRRYV